MSRHHLPIAIVLMIVLAVGLHAAGGMLLLQAGVGGLSLHNPLSYIMIGLLLVFAMVKLKHLRDFMRSKGK